MSDPDPWVVEASRMVVADPWIRLRADECRRADGVAIKPYYVLEYPDWAQVVAFTEDSRLILVRQYRHGIGRVTRELPAGCVEPGESPCAAGARELREETGYVCGALTHVATTFADPAHCTNRIFVLLGQGARRLTAPAPDATEDIVVEHVALETARELARTAGLDHAAQIASLALALSHLDRNRAV